MLYGIIAILIIWFLIGRVIVTLIYARITFSTFKEEWNNADILEKLCAIIWPLALIVFIISTIKE